MNATTTLPDPETANAAYAGTSANSLRHSLAEAGAPETLTRAAWEAENPRRPTP